jgi:hypothetical protein
MTGFSPACSSRRSNPPRPRVRPSSPSQRGRQYAHRGLTPTPIPHRPTAIVLRAGEADRVADHLARVTLGVPRAGPQPVLAQRLTNSVSFRLAPAHARTIRSSRCRLERSACSPRSPTPRPRRRSAAISPCFKARLPLPRVRASSDRSPNRCSSSRHAFCARGRSLCTLALLPSSATSVTTRCAWSDPPVERPWRIATALCRGPLAGESHL